MKWLLATVAVAALVLAGGSAFAGQNANGSIGISPSTAPAGTVVHISGSVSPDGCPTEDSAIPVSTDALFPPDGFGPNTDRDAQGAFDLVYTVPLSTPAGTYQIGLRCGGGNVGVIATLTVTADPVGAPATGAGGTAAGSSRQRVVYLGLACLGLAGALLALRHRVGRRTS